MADCDRLLERLRGGQEELRSSLRRLNYPEATHEAAKKNAGGDKERVAKRRSRATTESNSPLSREANLTTKRARTVQLSSDYSSPSRPHKPPSPSRRLSSTPKHLHSLVPPDADLSLEEALFRHQPNPRKKEEEMEEEEVEEREGDSEFHRSQVIVQSGRSGVSKGKQRGLSVSFVGKGESKGIVLPHKSSGNAENSRTHFTNAPSLGRRLIESLNTSRYGTLDRSMAEARKSRVFPRKYAGDDPALGYDWIAGLLDTGSCLAQHDDAYFEEMREFRRVNHDECSRVHESLPAGSLLHTPSSSSSSPAPSCSPKTSVTSYVLNDRLFPVPVHQSTGVLISTRCPVCEDPCEQKPSPRRHVSRVSVPQRVVPAPHHCKPHRRRSFNSIDSMGLSKHCLSGWESAQPSLPPPQSSMALSSHADTSLEPGGCGHKSRDLLNTSHSIEYNLRSRAAKRPRRQ